MKKYDIAAYIWPAYTGDDMRTRMFWPEGIGEWQTVLRAPEIARSKEDYSWERAPLWGAQNEADPRVMQQQIECAISHGVNVFIYDWYWYDDRPFLEGCLNDGFLKAPNCSDMRFYIMWANHDANYTWDLRNSSSVDMTIWRGDVTRAQFEKIGRRWINRYFKLDNYYKIEGKPVVSIYDLANLVKGLGGLAEVRDALSWLNMEAIKEGLAGVHLQFIRWDGKADNLSGVDGGAMETGAQITQQLGFNSLTHYQFVHFANVDRDYGEIMNDVRAEWRRIDAEYSIPYFPHISVGWDNNPRFLTMREGIVRGNTPRAFEEALRCAREYVDTHSLPVPLITVNSWNEWTETSYLLPDTLNGYGYLEAVKKVFCE